VLELFKAVKGCTILYSLSQLWKSLAAFSRQRELVENKKAVN